MVDHYATCLNNVYISNFYGQQYINQIYNVRKTPIILSFNEVAKFKPNISLSNLKYD